MSMRPTGAMTLAGVVVFLVWLVALVDGLLVAVALLTTRRRNIASADRCRGGMVGC